jgi:hypothetical protein
MSGAGSGRFGEAKSLSPHDSGFHPFVAGLPHGFLVAWAHGSGSESAIRIQPIHP